MSVRKFILVVGEDIVTDMTMPDVDKFSSYIYALSNSPRFVEIPVDSAIDKGWTWDGNNFYPPEN